MNYKFHYVYRITNLIENKHYYGKRSSNILPILDLGKIYFSSSRDLQFLKDQKENPNNYKYKVVAIFSNSIDAHNRETKLHKMFNVAQNKNFYNLSISTMNGAKFGAVGMSYMQNSQGIFNWYHSDDSRIISGELCGRKLYEETKKKLKYANLLKSTYKNSNDEIFYTTNTDPKVLSGELTHINKGKIVVKDKDNNVFSVSTTDPRYLSGELIGERSGFVIVKDSSNNVFSVSTTDPRYLSGELKHQNYGRIANDNQKKSASIAAKNTIPVVDMKGNKYRISIDDPGYGTIYKHVATKEVLYEDIYGNTFWDTKFYINRNLYKILYENNGKEPKFIYYTPWGKFNSVREATLLAPSGITYQNIKNWCKNSDIKITKSKINYLHLFNSSGKTLKELGFSRIEK